MLLVVCVVLGGVILFFWGKPIYGALKGWRAQRLAARSEEFMEEKKWREAADTVRAAYQLKPDEPGVLRAVAHLESRTGNATGAVSFWRQPSEPGVML